MFFWIFWISFRFVEFRDFLKELLDFYGIFEIFWNGLEFS